MSKPDPTESARESLPGRLWLGCAAPVLLILPVWMLLAAFFIQLDPALRGLEPVLVGGELVIVQAPSSLWAWGIGGARAAAALVAGLPVLMGLWLLTKAVGRALARRARQDRARYEALVGDGAVLEGVDWSSDAPTEERAEGQGGP